MKKPMSAKMKTFEKSGMDNDKGMKEGSAADKKADKAQMGKWAKMKGKKV